MMLFCKPDETIVRRLVIPLARVLDVIAFSKSIVINYDNGELMEVEGNMVKKIESVKIKFDSTDEVDRIIKQFYKACNNDVGAFYFG